MVQTWGGQRVGGGVQHFAGRGPAKRRWLSIPALGWEGQEQGEKDKTTTTGKRLPNLGLRWGGIDGKRFQTTGGVEKGVLIEFHSAGASE